MTNSLRTLAVSLCLLVSCDCFVSHEGFVIDSETEKPIPGASITFDNKKFKTDSLGHFQIRYMTVFCPDWDFYVEKEMYKSEHLVIDIENSGTLYRVYDSNDANSKNQELSENFKVKDKKIYFLLTKN